MSEKLDIGSIPRWRKVVYSVLPLLILLTCLEVVIRAVRAPLWLGSFRELRLSLARRGYPVQPDSVVGYVPAPTQHPMESRWGTLVTIDGEGFRSNGPQPSAITEGADAMTQAPIVAVGDSFTFGDQVNDNETWPAYLEAILGRPVRNGGVFGYALDQSVLRAEQILSRMPAEYLIVSIFPDDISRCEYSTRYAPKPYFDIVDGRLVLHTPEERRPQSPADERERRLKNFLGRSALLDGVFAATVTAWWYKQEHSVRVHPPGKGLEIANLLVDRIDALCRERGCRPLIVLQGRFPSAAATEVLNYADRSGIATLELIRRVQELSVNDPGIFKRFFDGHMTAAGNRWVAEEIAAALLSLEETGGEKLGARTVTSKSVASAGGLDGKQRRRQAISKPT